MAEVIDILFIFWFALAIVVYGIGSLYEKRRQEELERQRERQRKLDILSDRLSFSGPSSSYPAERYSSSSVSNKQQESCFAPSANCYSTNIDSPSVASGLQQSTGAGHNRFDYYQQSARTGSSARDRFLGSEEQFHSQPDALSKHTANYYTNYDGYTPASYEETSSIPTATGYNQECVDWVNNILYLFYSNSEKYGTSIAESVARSLNEKLSTFISCSPDYNNLMVEFKSINRQQSSRPELTNIRTEFESEKSISVNSKIYNQRLLLELTVERNPYGSLGTPLEQSDSPLHYELSLENLEGKLKSVVMVNDKLIVVQFVEKPEAKIVLRAKGYRQERQLINEDMLVSMILQTISQVVVDLYFGDEPDFPSYKSPSSYRHKLNNLLKGSASELKRQIKQDFFGALSSSSSGDKERKILVKILKASNINYNQNVTCLLEMDEPFQQAASSTKQGSNPLWDEHFLFNVSDRSKEICVELWDSLGASGQQAGQVRKAGSLSRLANLTGQSSSGKASGNKFQTAKGKFLGSVKISVEELRANPVQRVNLMLEPARRVEATADGAGSGPTLNADLSNSVGGELQLELLFMEHQGAAGSAGLERSQSSVSYKQAGDLVSIDRKLTQSGFVITTTTITKPKQKAAGECARVSPASQLMVRNQSPISSTSDRSSNLLEMNLDGDSAYVGRAACESPTPTEGQQGAVVGDDKSEAGRSRSRSRSRNFLRAIQKRFSFSRTRSRSVGESAARSGSGGLKVGRPMNASQGHNLDSASIESRSRASSVVSVGGPDGRARSVPVQQRGEPNELPAIVISRGARAGRSDASLGGAFGQPKSQLVIECEEPKMNAEGRLDKKNRLLRHYAIPDNSPDLAKWRRRGTKLHLLLGHQFTAVHLANSSTCHLCGRVFSRRPGKQGYRCRNCHLLSHKQCHVKVDHQCPYATKDSLNLEFIDADPPEGLLEELRGHRNADSLPRNLQRTPLRASISMDAEDVR